MKNNKEIPYVYIYVHYRIKKNFPSVIHLKPKEIIEVLKRICRVPKVLHYPILSQMERCNLIKRINHQKYKILKYDSEKVLTKFRYIDFWK